MFKDFSIFETLNNYYSKSETVLVSNSKRAMFEILTAICIINPDFLKGILDGGYKQRYTIDTTSFMTDVKNIILNNNTKFKIGQWSNEKESWINDEEISKIHYVFNENTEFDVEKNWNILVKADKLSTSIIEELKIDISDIKRVYWTGLDVFSNSCENIVIETEEDQHQICIKNIFGNSFTKTANEVLTDLFENEIDIYDDQYLDEWNNISSKWLKLIYDYTSTDLQKYILEWLDVLDVESISYDNYMKLRHPGKHNQKLGKHVPEFNKNIIFLRDLCKEIYNDRENNMENYLEFDTKWNSIKDEFLNSRILEHLFINQLKEMGNDGLYYMIEGEKYRTSTGKFKTNIINFLFSKILNTGGKEIKFFSDNGKNWTIIPANNKIIEDENIHVLYKYHSILNDIDNDFVLDIWIGSNEGKIIKKMLLGSLHFNWFGEMSNNLKCKLSFDYSIKD